MPCILVVLQRVGFLSQTNLVMQNHQFRLCNCQKISRTLSTIDSRNELLTPCIVVKDFLGAFDVDTLKTHLETIFGGFLESKQCEEMDNKYVAELYFYNRIIMELLENMDRSAFLNRKDIKTFFETYKN